MNIVHLQNSVNIISVELDSRYYSSTYSYKYYCLQHTMEVIKVEPDLDTESLNRSPFYEDALFDETQDRDPLLTESAEVKQEVKVSVFWCMHCVKEFARTDLV
jgi:hypothetical protein